MSTTQYVAWIGALSGLGSLFWNIYTKLTSGPKLKMTAYANMVLMPPPPHNPSLLKVTVQNAGTTPTTITNLCLFKYNSRWDRFRNRPSISAVVANHSGPQFPHKLEVGSEWTVTMEQDTRFEEWLQTDKLWCAVVHSFSKKPKLAKIFRPVFVQKTK